MGVGLGVCGTGAALAINGMLLTLFICNAAQPEPLNQLYRLISNGAGLVLFVHLEALI